MSKTINISFVGDDGQIWYANGYVDYQLKEKDKKIETLQNDLDREKSKVKEYGTRMLKAIEKLNEWTIYETSNCTERIIDKAIKILEARR